MIDAGTAFFIAPLYQVKADSTVVGDRRRKRDQSTSVVAVVAEGNQAFVARAVVPRQVARGQAGTQALVEDAFQVAFHDVVVTVGTVAAAKEVGGWQLFRVAHHHHLLAAGHGTDGVPHRDLRGLVEHHQVEVAGLGRKVLRDRQRAHQQARGQS